MAYERKDGDCVLFVNNPTNERQPHLKGSIQINGKSYDLAFWEKQGGNGRYYSGKLGGETKPKRQSHQAPSFAQKTYSKHDAPASSQFDDEIPWK